MFIEANKAAVDRALNACGTQAVGHVVYNIIKNDRIDTGLYKNSITYAVSSEAPAKTSYSADTGGRSGTYKGTAEPAKGSAKSVYIGSNVPYAIHVEEGTSRKAGTHDIKYGISDHAKEYKQIIEKYRKGG